MKHYTRKNWRETNAYEPEFEFNSSRARKNASEVKQVYRQRERAALNRMVDELVIEELSQSSEELRFLWGKYGDWREFANENSCSFSAETWR